MHFLTFIHQNTLFYKCANVSLSALLNHDVNQSQATLLMTSDRIWRYIADCTVANSWRYRIRRRVIFDSALELDMYGKWLP